jgi:hypothetical protein
VACIHKLTTLIDVRLALTSVRLLHRTRCCAPFSHVRLRANRTSSRHGRRAAFDRPCVKTHTSAKCRKHNSPARHRTSRVQRFDSQGMQLPRDISTCGATAGVFAQPKSKTDMARFVRRRSGGRGVRRSEDRLLKCWPELQICITQLTREWSPRRACTTSGKVATEFQSDSSRTDSPVRILNARQSGLRTAAFRRSTQVTSSYPHPETKAPIN